eukprot:TRINITY_DN1671_c1_g2_i4.p1 TRINITY_DN1671_c1_g2~~TRINITY_DN1671_c1_g2_i4.p1  ORF type:complete len:1503 (+),score=236.99 TRINITY_DN1671_c1_g2_i4:642-4511(+)
MGVLIARRSSRNPSSKSGASGLNSKASPPNEYEVEYILYTLRDRPSGKSDVSHSTSHAARIPYVREVQWASHVMRTGTIPTTRDDAVDGITRSKKCIKYWERLLCRYGGGCPVACLCLTSDREHGDKSNFEHSLNEVKKTFDMHVDFIHFDWRASVSNNGFDITAEALWKLLLPPLTRHGINSGIREYTKSTLSLVGSESTGCQQGIVRFTSTDGCNNVTIAVLTAVLQVIPEMCRVLGINHCGLESKGQTKSEVMSYPLREVGFTQLRNRYSKSLRSVVATLFAELADVVETIYLNLPGSTFGQYPAKRKPTDKSQDPQQSGKGNIISYLGEVYYMVREGVERTVAAMVESDRCTGTEQLELLLQQRVDKYFPSLFKEGPGSHKTVLVSHPSCATLVTAVPSQFKNLQPGISQETVLLSTNNGPQYDPWVVPVSLPHADLQIVLPQFCRLTEIHFTVRHVGASGETEHLSPVAVDVLVGHHADTCVPAFKGLRLPITSTDTVLRYTFPSHISGHGCSSLIAGSLYNFEDPITSPPPFFRVVQIVFHSLCAQKPMLLGNVQIYGENVTAGSSPNDLEEMLPKLTKSWRAEDIETPLSPGVELANRIGISLNTLYLIEDVDDLVPDSDDDDSDGLSDMEDQSKCDPPEAQHGTNDTKSLLNPPANDTAARPRSRSSAKKDPYPIKVFPHSPGSLLEAFAKYSKQIEERRRRAIDFGEALSLEYIRLSSGISSLVRDALLFKVGQAADDFNPSRLIHRRDPTLEHALRKKLQTPTCSVSTCQKSLRFSIRGKGSCAYCRMIFCKECLAKDKVIILEYSWDEPTHEVCHRCSDEILRQKAIVNSIQHLTKSQQKLREDNQLPGTNELYLHVFRGCVTKGVPVNESFEHLLNKPYSVAEDLGAAIYSVVPTSVESPPVETILYHEYRRLDANATGCSIAPLNRSTFWKAPPNLDHVTIDIVLPVVSHITSLVLLSDILGYSNTATDKEPDTLTISVSCGLMLNQLYPCGDWVVGPMQPETRCEYSLGNYPPEKGAKVVRLVVSKESPLKPTSEQETTVEKSSIHIGSILVLGLPTLDKKEGKGDLHDESVPVTRQRSGKSVSYKEYITRDGENDEVKKGGVNSYLEKYHEDIERVTLQKENEEWSPRDNALYITLKASDSPKLIMGFTVTRKADDRISQSRDIRVTFFRGTALDSLSHIHVGDYTTPTVDAGVALHYLFPVQYQLSSIRRVRIEVLSHYGGPKAVRPVVSMFTSPTVVSVPRDFQDTNSQTRYTKNTAEFHASCISKYLSAKN